MQIRRRCEIVVDEAVRKEGGCQWGYQTRAVTSVAGSDVEAQLGEGRSAMASSRLESSEQAETEGAGELVVGAHDVADDLHGGDLRGQGRGSLGNDAGAMGCPRGR